MATSERDTRNDDERHTAPQVEAPLDCNMQLQPMGEFMALHAETNATSTTHGQQMPIAAEQEEASKTKENEGNAGNAPHKKPKKRVRYLRDTERHNIIKPIENGEKQAALAREYGVTRAAICHIKKNRDEIITRYDLLVKQAQEIDRAENVSDQPGEEGAVWEISSSSALLLMTTLRDYRTSPAAFRRAAGRLIMLLLEEALATISARTIEMTTTTGYPTYGLERTDDVCGVAVGAEGFPFLVLFHQMEPDAPQGSIDVGPDGHNGWRLEHMDLPSDITRYRVLLFSSTVNTGGGECKAIEALCSLGVEESRITLVIILCSADSLVTICNRFPDVRIVTSAIDSEVDPETQAIIPGMGDFVARYNGE
ncbi:hypothetical protein PF005_g1569 [Phytophthora fragariae]|uniref:Uncharacterized protein n=1 Tax=Phytophthora fragariae TaxID=53985 RepID=A0A6A3MNE6_9STRA|nr:hypothetical protein PF009_g1593 [Phytophthora fragariae]KAE9029523.1 hypothetical protein PF011_g1044 [Phytophthora fragariae]KAE9137647.1 hypothetical protein PF010_g1216 [Phytophthora fragariae]KAE9138075.1 hypothetical protein PF007_g1545 [Phytophthora fragariae]KAE9154650.1 hypothetical protein PF006_g1294 [Phytophthora fragariae]